MQMSKDILFMSDGALPRDYRQAGVYELSTVDRFRLSREINFGTTVPTPSDLDRRAKNIARIAKKVKATMVLLEIPNMLCSRVERELKSVDITPVYAVTFLQQYAVICEEYDSDKFDTEVIKTKFVLRGMVEA